MLMLLWLFRLAAKKLVMAAKSLNVKSLADLKEEIGQLKGSSITK
jgi:DNA polymerase/3'-5' exonuclease PolX